MRSALRLCLAVPGYSAPEVQERYASLGMSLKFGPILKAAGVEPE